jgi:hypothetical protein
MELSKQTQRQYFDWQRHILKSQPKIPRECHRPTLIAFCLTLAIHGSHGLDCYASDSLIAREIGVGRKYLAKYRRVAIELGWFTPNGIKRNRVEHVDISIPVLQVDVRELVEVERVEGVEPIRLRSVEPPAYDPADDPWAS